MEGAVPWSFDRAMDERDPFIGQPTPRDTLVRRLVAFWFQPNDAEARQLTEVWVNTNWGALSRAGDLHGVIAQVSRYDEEVATPLQHVRQEAQRAEEEQRRDALVRHVAERRAWAEDYDPGPVSDPEDAEWWAEKSALPRPLYHATRHLGPILAEGLRPRQATGNESLGGGPDYVISLTPHQGAARSIAAVLAALNEAAAGGSAWEFFEGHWLPIAESLAPEKEWVWESAKATDYARVKEFLRAVAYRVSEDPRRFAALSPLVTPLLLGRLSEPVTQADVGYVQVYANVDAVLDDTQGRVTVGPETTDGYEQMLQHLHVGCPAVRGGSRENGYPHVWETPVGRRLRWLRHAALATGGTNPAEADEIRVCAEDVTVSRFVRILDWRAELLPPGARVERMPSGYYDWTPGTPLDEVIGAWQERGAKVYDRSMPAYYGPAALWPHREYTWSRNDARRSPAEWDELRGSLAREGWDPRDPLLLLIGRDGGVKVGEGNHRLAIARELGLPSVPVRFLFYSDHVTKSPQYPTEKPPQAARPQPSTPEPRSYGEMSPEEQAEMDDLLAQILGPGAVERMGVAPGDFEEELRRFGDAVEQQLGLENFYVHLTHHDAIKLDTIIVPKTRRGEGLGTRAMELLTAFADRHQRRIVLSPDAPGDQAGTTSRARLVRFYKRFGFIENKGRNKNYAFTEMMFRRPQPVKPERMGVPPRVYTAREAAMWLPYTQRAALMPRDWEEFTFEPMQIDPTDRALPHKAPYSKAQASQYERKMREGDTADLPPVILLERDTDERGRARADEFGENPERWVDVADGEHRLYAARRAGLGAIPALVGRKPDNQGPILRRVGAWVERMTVPVVERQEVSRTEGDEVRGLTFTRGGFPWPENTPAFHATTGLRGILREGFKPREDVGMSAVGGGTSRAVSFALDPRVCISILVGLRVLRAGARGEMTIMQLIDAARKECPRGVEAALRYKAQEGTTLQRLSVISRGYRFRRGATFGKAPQPDWIVEKTMADIMGRDTEHLRSLAAEWYEPDVEYARDMFAEVYKSILAMAEHEREAYNPLFFGTDMARLAEIAEEDLGAFRCYLRAPRIVASYHSARTFGFLDENAASRTYVSEFLNSWENKVASYLDDGGRYRDKPPTFANAYGVPKQIGIFKVVDEGEVTASQVLVAVDSMSEVRVYDPSRIEIDPVGTITIADIVDRYGLRVTYPFFREMDGVPMPGTVSTEEPLEFGGLHGAVPRHVEAMHTAHPKAREYDEIAAKLLAWWEENDPGDGIDPADIKRGLRRLGLPPLLGAGSGRVVLRVPAGALKVGQPKENRREAQVWSEAPPEIRRFLVPVLGVSADGRWLLMERVQATGKGRVPMDVYDLLSTYGIRDITDANLSDDGRMLDYAMVELSKHAAVERNTIGGAAVLDAATEPTFTWAGFPWPESTHVYHATGAAKAILREGFKTRVQGVGAAAGGRHRWSVSFTLLPQRAAAIALGLDTLHRAVTGQLTVEELYQRLAAKCPKGILSAVHNLDELGDLTDPAIRAAYDAGYTIGRYYDGEDWQTAWYEPGVIPAAEYNGHKVYSYHRFDVATQLYTGTLRAGEWNGECFNPVFIGTEFRHLADLDPNSIGVLDAKLLIPRICAGPRGAVQLGYIDEAEARRMGDSFVHNCESDLEGDLGREGSGLDRKNPAAAFRYWPGQLGDFKVTPEGERTPADTMVYNEGEQEVRVFAPQRVRVLGFEGITALRKKYALGDRLTFPLFDDRAVDVRVWRSVPPKIERLPLAVDAAAVAADVALDFPMFSVGALAASALSAKG